MDDFRELLRESAASPRGDLDLDDVRRRATRFRRHQQVRAAIPAVALVALVVTLGWSGWRLFGPDHGVVIDQPSPQPTEHGSEPAPEHSTEPTPTAPESTPAATTLDFDPGPALTVEDMPVMAAEGVAVRTSSGVVFVGLDGTVYGHLPGAALEDGGPGRYVPGLLSVNLPLDPDTQPEDANWWVQPAAGSATPSAGVTPLLPGHRVVEQPGPGDPSPLVLELVVGDETHELARFSPNLHWNVSAGHRFVSWHECPDDAPDLGSCTAHAYDTDMGGLLKPFEPGCSVSDGLGDFAHLVVCAQHWEPSGTSSWIEARGPGAQEQEVTRIDLPRYEGQPDDVAIGHYVNAFYAGDGYVATWLTECEVPRAVIAEPGSPPRSLLGDDLATAPAARVLGATRDRDVVVRVYDSPCTADDEEPGIYTVDTETGAVTPVVVSLDITTAMMWNPWPQLDESAR